MSWKLALSGQPPSATCFFQHLSPAPQMNLSFLHVPFGCFYCKRPRVQWVLLFCHTDKQPLPCSPSQPWGLEACLWEFQNVRAGWDHSPCLVLPQLVHRGKLRPGLSNLKSMGWQAFLCQAVCTPHQQWSPKALACWPQPLRSQMFNGRKTLL